MSSALVDPLGDEHAPDPPPAEPVARPESPVADEVVLPGQSLATALTDEVWALLELEQRTPDEDDLLVHAAHAAAYHVRDDGTPSQIVRSEWLCSRVHAVLGRSEASLHHARRTLALCTSALIGDWDLAFAHEALARAHAVAGDGAAARRHMREARDVRIADRVHRDLLEADLATIPGRHRSA